MVAIFKIEKKHYISYADFDKILYGGVNLASRP